MSALDAALLRALRAAAVECPVAELAGHLGAPQVVVRERIDELRAAGFEIEERPGFGYRLLAAPDRLISDDLLARLGPSEVVREIIVFEQTDSTNDRAAQLGRDGIESGVAIFAERQTAGRGRFGRRWQSASHLGLWFSLLLRPELPLAAWPRVTTWAAVAVAIALEKTASVRAAIKWPNDVFVAGRKVAGILTETGTDSARRPFAVLGIGVNVNHQMADFPPELLPTAGSLCIAAGHAVDRSELAAGILRELEARQGQLKDRFAELVHEAGRRSFLLGRWLQVRAGDSVVEGLAEELDGDGRLLLRDRTGALHRLNAGEVTVLAI